MIDVTAEVEKAVERGRPADRELARIFRQNRGFGSHDRRLYSAGAFSLMRWRGWTGAISAAGPIAGLCANLLDAQTIAPHIFALADALDVNADKLQPLGELGIEAKAEALAGMGLHERAPAPEDLIPKWTWDALPFREPAERMAWLETIQRPRPVWLRFDSGHEEHALSFLEANGIETSRHELIQSAWMTETNISRAVLNARKAACIHLQDLSSQAVATVCAPAAEEKWWDTCAGAGGKSLHLADLLAHGTIVATDTRPQTLRNLHKRRVSGGMSRIRTEKLDATKSIPREAPFDGVLVDAPCSGVGTWARNPDARWRTDPEFVNNRARLQLKLLENASEAVKPGGKLVYAVCSPLPKETSAVVSAFAEQHPRFRLTPFQNPLAGGECPGNCLIDGIRNRSIAMYIAVFTADLNG